MDDSPQPLHTAENKLRLPLIYQSKSIIVEVWWENGALAIEKVEGPRISKENLLRLVKTSLLPRTG
jgi:hypothetical protein